MANRYYAFLHGRGQADSEEKKQEKETGKKKKWMFSDRSELRKAMRNQREKEGTVIDEKLDETGFLRGSTRLVEETNRIGQALFLK